MWQVLFTVTSVSSFGATTAKKGPNRHLDVSEILEERIHADSFLSANPYGRYLFEAEALFDWFDRGLDAGLMQRSLPINRIGDLLAEDFEAKRKVAYLRPEKKSEERLKNPVENIFDRIVVGEAASRQPSVGDYAVAACLQDLFHHSIHRRRLRFQVGSHEGYIVPRRCLHALAVGPADARIVLLDQDPYSRVLGGALSAHRESFV